MPGPEPADRLGAAIPEVVVPEVRDYTRINAELAALLDAGHPHVRLSGVDGQRLLVHGLRGSWRAVVEVCGNAGPELAADLDAPGLIVVCTGSALDGAGRGLRQGRLLVRGDVGAAAGYAQSGGTIVVSGSAGPRAGLDQSGGLLVLAGPVGRLASERQSGGCAIVIRGPLSPRYSRGQSGGRMVGPRQIGEDERAILRATVAEFGSWWPERLPLG